MQTVLVGDMQKAPILDIGVAADVYPVYIGPYNSMKPDAGAFCDMCSADDDSGRGDEDGLMNFRLVIFKREKHALKNNRKNNRKCKTNRS